MNFNQYQELAIRTHDLYRNPMAQTLLLKAVGAVGEAAEVLEHVKKHVEQGHRLDPEKIEIEVGDVLNYLATICELNNTTLERAAIANIEKLERRYPEGKFSVDRSVNRAD